MKEKPELEKKNWVVAGEAGKDRRKRSCSQREEEGCGS